MFNIIAFPYKFYRLQRCLQFTVGMSSQKGKPTSADDSGKLGTLARVAQKLRNYSPHASTDGSTGAGEVRFLPGVGVRRNRAAVLICLFEQQIGDIRVILTRRSSTMSSHSGEVALPGGRWEEGDVCDADTALREAKEEIGLDPSAVEVVTTLEPFYTKRNITVYPVIGILWDKNGFKPVLNATEVESVFDAPLAMFLKNENRREKKQELMGHKFVVQLFDYQAENRSYLIWALTAAILIKAASVVFQRPPDFEVGAPFFWGRSRF